MIETSTQTLQDRLRQKMDELGVSQRRLSIQSGMSGDIVRSLLRRDTANPRASTIEAIARALKVTPTWLLSGEEAAAGARPVAEVALDAVLPSTSEGGTLTEPQTMALARDAMSIPVLGTAAGSFVGEFQFEGSIIDYVDRPAVLRRTPDAYAIYVTGTSMEPEHRQGDLRFVHPNKPPRPGDSVIVQTRNSSSDNPEAFIGHLKTMTGDEVVIEKLNPKQAEVRIPRRFVKLVHRVLTMNELFGR